MLNPRRVRVAVVVTAWVLAACGLPAVAATLDSPLAPVQAPATSGAQVRVSAKAPTKVTVEIAGKLVTRRVARPTRLQRHTGATWVVDRRAITAVSGRVVYRLPAPAATTRYRVVAPATTVRVSREVHGRTVSERARLRAWTGHVTTVTVQEPERKPWVTGYYAGWYWDGAESYAPEDVDMSAMTHFVFGRVAPGGGSLEGEPNNENYPDYPYEPGDVVPGAGSAHRPSSAPDGSGRSVEDYLVDRAHAAGTKALLMLGGDGGDGRGYLLSTADDVRAEFVDNIVDYLVEHDYDGVDLDWENCLEGSSGCGESDPEHPIPAAEAQRRLMALIADLRAETATRARYADAAALVTYPGYALNTNYQTPNGMAEAWRADIAKAVDQYNLMSYGGGTTMNGAEWGSWFSGALTGAGPAHPVDIASSVDAYVAAGVPRSRIGLGIGFYGVYWGPTITGPRQSTNGNDIWEIDDNSLGYGDLDRMGYTRSGTRHWDEDAQSTYRTYEQYGGQGYVPAFNPQHPLDSTRAPAGFLSYEDEQSIAAKADWVEETGVGGAILWTINYGWVPRTQSNPLLAAVKRSFIG